MARPKGIDYAYHRNIWAEKHPDFKVQFYITLSKNAQNSFLKKEEGDKTAEFCKCLCIILLL